MTEPARRYRPVVDAVLWTALAFGASSCGPSAPPVAPVAPAQPSNTSSPAKETTRRRAVAPVTLPTNTYWLPRRMSQIDDLVGPLVARHGPSPTADSEVPVEILGSIGMSFLVVRFPPSDEECHLNATRDPASDENGKQWYRFDLVEGPARPSDRPSDGR